MKILYLAHRLPYPPNKGEKIRTFHQIEQLAKRHTIHLCTFVDDPDDIPHVETLRRYCASVEFVYRSNAPAMFLAPAGLLRGLPFSIALFYRKAFATKVKNKLATERIDCLFASSSSMAQYARFASDCPKVIDFIDVDCEKWRLYAQHHSFPLNLIYQVESERLAKYEERAARTFDHCILISEEEQAALQKRVQDRAISVISNGVDLEYFNNSGVDTGRGHQPIVVFTGVMDYFPNVDAVNYFCRTIFPLVRNSAPEAQFYIVGRNPAPAVLALKKHPNVVVTGTVSDVRPYVARAAVAIAPLRIAPGVQNKILEAMALGVPVVGSTQSFKGIRAGKRDGIRVADDPRSFARHVVDLLRSDPSTRSEIARQARSYVERFHRWDEQGDRLERLLHEIILTKVARGSLMVEGHELASVAKQTPARS